MRDSGFCFMTKKTYNFKPSEDPEGVRRSKEFTVERFTPAIFEFGGRINQFKLDLGVQNLMQIVITSIYLSHLTHNRS